jgi:FKBP-type peptidyl-prolyl cis-trans isomerase
MMKLKWIVLLGLTLLGMQARAEEAVVIDAQAVGEPPAAAKAAEHATAPAEAPSASPAEANRARVLKGGKMSQRQKTAMAKATLAESNKQQGESFLAANKIKDGVVSLPSGVQYKILKAAKGKTPGENSMVACRYRGTLTDGTSFDKTDAKTPAALSVAGFLPGLREAVKLMPAGSKWQIVVPPQLAYGESGDRGVGPNAVLIYEMEIVSFK